MSIIVGVDGSASALNAVRAAAHQAVGRKTELRIVHAFIWPFMHVPLGPSPSGPPNGGLRNEAYRILAEAMETALLAEPTVRVETALITGAPTAVLLSEAHSAELIVIGDRGLGAVAEILIGSVALQVAERSPVPVLVVKGRVRASGPVVVGLDGSCAAERALRVAFAESECRHTELVAVHVKGDPVLVGAARTELVDRDAGPRPHGTVIDAERRRSDVPAKEEILVGDPGDPGDPGESLVARAQHAQLLVVATNSRNGFLGLLLGSVARHVLRHALCPVLIVPPPSTDEKGKDR